ncbi:MAG: DUF938 domain-containing protein, partial [Paracoccaceae bacterium]
PAAGRNYAPILEVLRPYVPARVVALELASGTGQHIARLAAAFPQLSWQPSDIHPRRLASTPAWVRASGLANLRAPVTLDAAAPAGWPAALHDLDLIYVVNLFHLITRPDAIAVIGNIAAALKPEGCVFIYGPFTFDGAYRSAGDKAFDTALRSQDAQAGYKDAGWMRARLKEAGLSV